MPQAAVLKPGQYRHLLRVTRINEIRSAKDPDAVLSKQIRLMGYMEALEDQGLLTEKEVSAYDAQANRAAEQRLAKWLEHNRQDKSK